ncbi:MAG: FAD binding domain-containing protein, partial [Candidatus Thermoplasmatota archaeon]
ARVEEMRELTTLRIGALVTLARIEKSGMLATSLPVLPQAAKQIATPLLRASGTLGGNLLLENRCFFFNQTHFWRKSLGYCLKADGDGCRVVPQKERCYATFSADMPAALMVLGASMELSSATSGTRSLTLAQFYDGQDGIARNSKQADELVTSVTLPKDATQWRASYKKLRLRESFDFPELGIAAAVRFDGQRLAGFRLVANALDTKPIVLDHLGANALGKPLQDEDIKNIAKAAEGSVRPVKNTNLPPSYRKAMTRVFTERVLREIRH